MRFDPTLDVIGLATLLLAAIGWVVRLEVNVRQNSQTIETQGKRLDAQESALERKITSEVSHVYRSLDDIKRMLERMETKLDGKVDK